MYTEATIMDLIDFEEGTLVVPPTVKKIISPYTYGDSLYHEVFTEGFIPDWIESLTIREGFSGLLKPGLLPKGLKELVIDMSENTEQEIDLQIQEGTLPPRLEILRVSTAWDSYENPGNFYIVDLPNTLRIIEFPDYFDFDGDLPSSLESIKFGTRQTWWWNKEEIPRSLKFVSNYFDNHFQCDGEELRFVWMQFKIIALLNHQTKKMKADIGGIKMIESQFSHTSSNSSPKRFCLTPLQNIFNNPYLLNDIYQYILPQREEIDYELSGFYLDYAETVFFFSSLKKMFQIDESMIQMINPSILRKIDEGVYKLYLRDDNSCEIDHYISKMEDDNFEGTSGLVNDIHIVFSEEELYT